MKFSNNLLPSEIPYSLEFFNILSLTFKELMLYEQMCPKDEYDRLIFDCEFLIKNKYPKEWNMLYAYDIHYFLFMIRYATCTNEDYIKSSVNCPHCSKEVDFKIYIDKLQTRPLLDQYYQGFKIKILDKEFDLKSPKAEEFLKSLKQLRHDNPKSLDLSIVKAHLGFDKDPNVVGRYVDNAIHDSIIILRELVDSFKHNIKPLDIICEYCTKEVLVDISNSIYDTFRHLKLNSILYSNHIKDL